MWERIGIALGVGIFGIVVFGSAAVVVGAALDWSR